MCASMTDRGVSGSDIASRTRVACVRRRLGALPTPEHTLDSPLEAQRDSLPEVNVARYIPSTGCTHRAVRPTPHVWRRPCARDVPERALTRSLAMGAVSQAEQLAHARHMSILL
jgi:hypothetical protein